MYSHLYVVLIADVKRSETGTEALIYYPHIIIGMFNFSLHSKVLFRVDTGA